MTALPVAAGAAAFAVDDSATVVHAPTLQMRWRGDRTGPCNRSMVDGRASVDLVLDSRAWIGRDARVYMLLAPSPVRFNVLWTTAGTLQSGRIEPGRRARGSALRSSAGLDRCTPGPG